MLKTKRIKKGKEKAQGTYGDLEASLSLAFSAAFSFRSVRIVVTVVFMALSISRSRSLYAKLALLIRPLRTLICCCNSGVSGMLC